MKQETRIQALLDKYLDGATSAAEEQELRRYFASAGEGVPDRWAPFKALFAYVDTERQAEAPLTVPHSRAKARLTRLSKPAYGPVVGRCDGRPPAREAL